VPSRVLPKKSCCAVVLIRRNEAAKRRIYKCQTKKFRVQAGFSLTAAGLLNYYCNLMEGEPKQAGTCQSLEVEVGVDTSRAAKILRIKTKCQIFEYFWQYCFVLYWRATGRFGDHSVGLSLGAVLLI